jgi:hypothetical protein
MLSQGQSQNQNKCSIIKNNFLLDLRFKTPKKLFTKNQIQFTDVNELLCGFCNVNKDNEIILDYRYFNLLYDTRNFDENYIINYVIEQIQNALNHNSMFVVHVCLKSLSLVCIDKYYQFICKIAEILKLTFPDKLEKCFIYNAPFIFSQFFSIISAFVDKHTLSKVQLIE